MEFMEIIKPIGKLCLSIYKLVEKVKANKESCRSVAKRVELLEELVVKEVQQRKAVLKREAVEKALKELESILTSARDLIEGYTKSTWILHALKVGTYREGFGSVNDRLSYASRLLFGVLQLEQGHTLYAVFEQTNRREQDEKDRQDDKEELRRYFDAFQTDMMALLSRPSVMDEMPRMIKEKDLTFDFPKEPFMTTSSAQIYKGQYHRITVAIKRFTYPEDASPKSDEISTVFNREVQTMKRFESPNILRMYGICVIDPEGPKPDYLIVMEYCERGNLRKVLDTKELELSWPRKAHMCLDAARALYRLHDTEDRYKVHGSISSSKFLVDENFRVKLGGFELAQTESSLNRNKKGKKVKKIRSWCYSSPQMLNNFDVDSNSKECEVYSLGIVMWEIVTRQKPLENWDKDTIIKRVGKGYREPLPDGCPEGLGKLINECRAFDSFQRPKAGVLMDKLTSLVRSEEELQYI